MLCPGGKDRIDRFPAHQQHSWNDRILEEQAESQKHSAITETSESRYQEIGAQLGEAGTVENVRSARGTEAAVRETKAGKNRGLEKHDGNDRAGQKLSNHQNFFSDRHEKLIVERTLHHFAAEQPRKDSHAGEENAEPEIINLDNSREYECVVFDLARIDVAPVEDIVREQE